MTNQPSNRLGHATEQLDDAISLFLKRHFVSALTLAGAAEEIFGKALSHRGEQNALDRKYEVLEPIHRILEGRPLSRKAFIRDENCALIAVTHMESASDTSVTHDLEEAALWTIVRACENSDRLGLPRTAKMREFDNWFDEHVSGVADPPPEACHLA